MVLITERLIKLMTVIKKNWGSQALKNTSEGGKSSSRTSAKCRYYELAFSCSALSDSSFDYLEEDNEGASDLKILYRSLIKMIPHAKDPGVQQRYAIAKEGREAKATPKAHVEGAVFHRNGSLSLSEMRG